MSLVEILIAVAMAALLLVLAAPSFQALQARRALEAAISAVQSDFALARSEAIKRGHSVTICSSVDGAACDGGSAAPFDWTQGWIVYQRPAPAAAAAAASAPASAPLRVQGPLAGIRTLQGSDDQFTFGATGLGRASSDHLVVTPQADPAQARWLCVSMAGRLRLAPPGATQC